MCNSLKKKYKRCFIAAPFGIDLDVLYKILEKRGISWQWAKDEVLENKDALSVISAADFVIVVIDGTKADYNSLFDSGVAVGLGKPVLLIQTKKTDLPLDCDRFTIVNASLSNGDALGFHLDLFLDSPPVELAATSIEPPKIIAFSRSSKTRASNRTFDSALEERVFDAVVAAGGSATPQPISGPDVKFRPDFLAWLGNLDSEFLDPVVIEVKSSNSIKNAHLIDKKLLKFMGSARFKMALVLTDLPQPQRLKKPSPNVLWMTIEEFERLTTTEQLGRYIRETRNRIAHGVR